MSKCKYCGSTSFGGCGMSPHGRHEHSDIGDKCVYCGSSGYGNEPAAFNWRGYTDAKRHIFPY